MGACYDVKLKLSFQDKEKGQINVVKAMREYIKAHDGRGVDFSLVKWESLGVTPDTF